LLVVHGTKKFLDRVKCLSLHEAPDTTLLGPWYATVLFWKPQVAFFMNEATFFPVLLPLAPSATVLQRFPVALESLLRVQNIPSTFVEHELAEMDQGRLEKTTSRQVLGVMNDFSKLARYSDRTDLTAVSLELASTPCGPLRRSTGFPDLELAAFTARNWPHSNIKR
jgi:hypothetical protein